MTAPVLLIAVVWVSAAHSAELRVDAAGRLTTPPPPLRSPSEAEDQVEAAAPAPELRVSGSTAAMLRVQGAVAAAEEGGVGNQPGVLRPRDVFLTTEDLDRDEAYKLAVKRVRHEHKAGGTRRTLEPMRYPAGAGANATAAEKKRKPLGLFGGGLTPARTAFVISPEALFDAKVNILWQLGFDAQRIAPTHTTQNCIGGLESRTGTFLGHRDAWKHVAALGKKALILEADWSIGDMSPLNAQKLALQLHRLGDRDDDLTKVGSCGTLCNTAYYLSPALAGMMQHEDACQHKDGTDVWVKELCFNETQIQGHSIKCRIVKGGNVYAKSHHLYGSGLIFQDREHIKGLHDAHNKGTYSDSHYDTW